MPDRSYLLPALYFLCILSLPVNFPAPVAAQDYILGAGDVLTISVYDHPDLTTTVRISGDGMIVLPLIGQVQAGERSLNQLREMVEVRLADGYIVNPQVSIFMEEFRSRTVTILGEVEHPGVYEIKGHTTFLELISQAGGLTKDAARQAFVNRRAAEEEGDRLVLAGSRAALVVNLKELMEKGQASQNIDIVAGDNIYIPPKDVFYVSGQVEDPGPYNHEEGLTVIQALTMAGGATDKAATNRIRIIRTKEGKEHLIKEVRLDMRVRPNDVIVVPESYF